MKDGNGSNSRNRRTSSKKYNKAAAPKLALITTGRMILATNNQAEVTDGNCGNP